MLIKYIYINIIKMYIVTKTQNRTRKADSAKKVCKLHCLVNLRTIVKTCFVTEILE